jgi:hypothetical protein
MISKLFSRLWLRQTLSPPTWPARCLVFALALSCKGSGREGLSRMFASVGVTTGLTDPTTPPPEAVFFLCDATLASTCNEARAAEGVEGVARYAFSRPGSEVRLFVLGETVAETIEVASITVPARAEGHERVVSAEERRFVETARRSLCPPLRPHLTGRRPRRSPIVESLAKLAMVNTHGLPRRILYLGDLREVGVTDFECGRIPTASQWSTLLRRRNLFGEGTFANTRVHLALVEGTPVEGRGCVVSVARELAIRERFREALTQAGAVRITFDTGLPDITRLFTEESTGAAAVATTNSRRPR